MKYRTLGKTGWEISAVSMGCWGLGGQWGPVGEQQAIETVNAALDAGVNLFDTADSYGMGVSEQLTGKALKGRDDVYIATKVGNWGGRHDDRLRFNTVYSVIECCHASLYRLGRDVIDLYQCHQRDPERPDVFLEAFELLKQQGKIRHYGISTNSVDALKALDANGQCAACQIDYSILAREAETAILDHCLSNNIGVLLRGPIAHSMLADKFSADTVFADIVREKWNEGEGREQFLSMLEQVERLRPLVRDDRTMAQAALQFTLAHPAATCPIPGMKTPEQARENAAAADGELTQEELALIDNLFPHPK